MDDKISMLTDKSQQAEAYEKTMDRISKERDRDMRPSFYGQKSYQNQVILVDRAGLQYALFGTYSDSTGNELDRLIEAGGCPQPAQIPHRGEYWAIDLDVYELLQRDVERLKDAESALARAQQNYLQSRLALLHIPEPA